MDLKCSIIHKHFFFSAAILVPFPNILLLKRIITMQKQKVRRIKVFAAGRGWHVSCVCVLAWAAPVPTVPGLGAAALCQFLQGLCCSPLMESNTGEGGVGLRGDVINSPSQLWRLIPYAVFPSFLITQMTTIVIFLTGTASPEDTTSPHTHALSSSPFMSPHSSHLMPFPTPSPAGPTAEAGKEKKENNNEKDAFFFLCVRTGKGNDLCNAISSGKRKQNFNMQERDPE